MKKASRFTLLLLALAAIVFWLAPRGGKPGLLIVKNTGTDTVFLRTSPPLKLPRLAFTLRAWPPLATPVPLNAVILNSGCVVTQKVPQGARIEICTAIPSGVKFEGIARPDGVILTDGYSPMTTNLVFRTVWQGSVQRLEAEVDGNAPSNKLFRVLKVEE